MALDPASPIVKNIIIVIIIIIINIIVIIVVVLIIIINIVIIIDLSTVAAVLLQLDGHVIWCVWPGAVSKRPFGQ